MLAPPISGKPYTRSPSHFDLEQYLKKCDDLEETPCALHLAPVGVETISSGRSSDTACELYTNCEGGEAKSQWAESALQIPFESPLPRPGEDAAMEFIAEIEPRFPHIGKRARQRFDIAELLGAHPLMNMQTAIDILRSAGRATEEDISKDTSEGASLQNFFNRLQVHRHPVIQSTDNPVTLPSSNTYVNLTDLQSDQANLVIDHAYTFKKSDSSTLLDGALPILLKYFDWAIARENVLHYHVYLLQMQDSMLPLAEMSWI